MLDEILSCGAILGIVMLCSFVVAYVLSFDKPETKRLQYCHSTQSLKNLPTQKNADRWIPRETGWGYKIGKAMRNRVLRDGHSWWMAWPGLSFALWLTCSSMQSVEMVATGAAVLGTFAFVGITWGSWCSLANRVSDNNFNSAWGRAVNNICEQVTQSPMVGSVTSLICPRRRCCPRWRRPKDKAPAAPDEHAHTVIQSPGVVDIPFYSVRGGTAALSTSGSESTKVLRTKLNDTRSSSETEQSSSTKADEHTENSKHAMKKTRRIFIASAFLCLSAAWWWSIYVLMYSNHKRNTGAPDLGAFERSKIAPYVFDATCLRNVSAGELSAADDFAFTMLDQELSVGGVVGSALANILLLMSTVLASVPIPWGHEQLADAKQVLSEQTIDANKRAEKQQGRAEKQQGVIGGIKKVRNDGDQEGAPKKCCCATLNRALWYVWVCLMCLQLVCAYVALAMVVLGYLSAQHRFGSCMRTTEQGLPLLHAAALVGGAFYPPILSKLALIATYNAILVEGMRVADVEPSCEIKRQLHENEESRLESNPSQSPDVVSDSADDTAALSNSGTESSKVLRTKLNDTRSSSETEQPTSTKAGERAERKTRRISRQDRVLPFALSTDKEGCQHGLGIQLVLCAPILVLWGLGYLMALCSFTFIFGLPLFLFSSVPLLLCVLPAFYVLRRAGEFVFMHNPPENAFVRAIFRKMRSSFAPFVIKLPSDGNGVIDHNELKKILKEPKHVAGGNDLEEVSLWKLMGCPKTKEEINTIYGDIDEDGDGEITWDEFLQYFKKIGRVKGVKAGGDHHDNLSEHAERGRVTEKTLKMLFEQADLQPSIPLAFRQFWAGQGSNLNFALAQGLAAFALSVPVFGGALVAFAVYAGSGHSYAQDLLWVLCEIAMGCSTSVSDGCGWSFQLPGWDWATLDMPRAFRIMGHAVSKVIFYYEADAMYWRRAAIAAVSGSVAVSIVRFVVSQFQPKAGAIDLAIVNTTANEAGLKDQDGESLSEFKSLKEAMEAIGGHRGDDIVNDKGRIVVRPPDKSVIIRVLRYEIEKLKKPSGGNGVMTEGGSAQPQNVTI